MQSQGNLQHPRQYPVSQWIAQRQDGICQLPVGAAWFDVFPWQEAFDKKALTLVVYPNQNLLKNHAFRLHLMGAQDFETLTSDTAPHAERYLWERLANGETPVLLMTARKLQSVYSLGQLIRHPNLGPILIQQAHQVVPHLWGPVANPYYKLCDFFQNQWPHHPPLILFTHPLNSTKLSQLAMHFMLKQPFAYRILMPLENLQLNVERHVTQHQKLRALKDRIGAPHPQTASITLVICQSLKAIYLLENALQRFHPTVIHHRLDERTCESRLLAVLQKDEPVVLLESEMLDKLPSHLFSAEEIHLIHWQMPWSPEAFVQQVLPATKNAHTMVKATVLYSKEDFIRQKNRLKSYFSEDFVSLSASVDHLNRLRLGYRSMGICRYIQLKNWLGERLKSTEDCKTCDVCLNRSVSSRWMNIISAFLY